NQVVTAFELHINIGPGVVRANSQLDQAAVHPDQHEGDDNQYTQNDPGHSFSLSLRSGNQRDGNTGPNRAQLAKPKLRDENTSFPTIRLLSVTCRFRGTCSPHRINGIVQCRDTMTAAQNKPSCSVTVRSQLRRLYFALVPGLLLAGSAYGQTCLTASDMDEATRTALVNTAKRYFDMAARGDSASLRQNSIASLASDFSGIESAVKDNQSNFAGAQAPPRPPFLLKAEGTAPLSH